MPETGGVNIEVAHHLSEGSAHAQPHAGARRSTLLELQAAFEELLRRIHSIILGKPHNIEREPSSAKISTGSLPPIIPSPRSSYSYPSNFHSSAPYVQCSEVRCGVRSPHRIRSCSSVSQRLSRHPRKTNRLSPPTLGSNRSLFRIPATSTSELSTTDRRCGSELKEDRNEK
jgi:hypothetical protein